MKKIIIFAAAAAMFSLASCQKVEIIGNGIGDISADGANGSPVFTASISGQTKTAIDVADGKVAWETTDEITVTDASSASAIYKIESVDTETGKATFVIKDDQTIGDGPYTATYGTEPTAEQTYSAVAGKLYMTAPETSGNSFTFTVQCGLMKINLTKPGESVTSIAVTGTPTGGSETTYTLTCTEAQSIAEARDFFIALPAGEYCNIEIVNGSGATASLNAASGVNVAANHIRPLTFGESKLNFVKVVLVDLGLSVKWATCNLGATKPEESGGYFQWAGTEDVSDLSINLTWENCPYHTGGSYETGWTKYNTQQPYGTVDGKTTLDPEDDAAHMILGENWRIPTAAEWNELKEYCTWTWTTLNNVRGYKVSSDIPGFVGNWIFLPTAGYRYGNSLMGIDAYSKYGLYWSSSLHTDTTCDADSFGIRYHQFLCPTPVAEMGYNSRSYGYSIRPVSDEE